MILIDYRIRGDYGDPYDERDYTFFYYCPICAILYKDDNQISLNWLDEEFMLKKLPVEFHASFKSKLREWKIDEILARIDVCEQKLEELKRTYNELLKQ